MARYLLVGNPTAQSGRNQERIAVALELLAAAGLGTELLATLPHGGTLEAVRERLDADTSIAAVIAMGGDGTFREVAAGLYTSSARERTALAMLPTGTANDQGKSFGVEATPEALERNVEVIRQAHETRLDVGILHAGDAAPVHFFDSLGWGLSARVLAQRNRDRSAIESLGPLKEVYRDHAVYAGAFLKTFFESYVVPDKLRVEAVLDGQRLELEGITDLVVKNTRIYAGAWVLDRASRHDDGVFELVPFRGKRDWAARALASLEGSPWEAEGLGLELSPSYRAASFELTLHPPESGAPLAAQIDGEEWPANPHVRVEVMPRGLRLIVPRTLEAL